MTRSEVFSGHRAQVFSAKEEEGCSLMCAHDKFPFLRHLSVGEPTWESFFLLLATGNLYPRDNFKLTCKWQFFHVVQHG